MRQRFNRNVIASSDHYEAKKKSHEQYVKETMIRKQERFIILKNWHDSNSKEIEDMSSEIKYTANPLLSFERGLARQIAEFKSKKKCVKCNVF